MKKFVKVGVIFAMVSLVLLMAIGYAAAEGHDPTWADHEFWPLPKPVQGEEGQEVTADGTSARIDFEQSEDSAKKGWYVIEEVDGPRLAAWYAYDGWQDSGWITQLSITDEAVYVRVLYYPDDSTADSDPTVMTMINHAPGKEYGWLALGVAHALEVEFPE
jgi:hypothetical protein